MLKSVRRNVLSSESKKCFVKEAFRALDDDGDGYLDYYEAKAAMKALGIAVKKSFVVATIRMYDKRGDGKISFDDFSYVVLDKLSKQNQLDEIKYAFTCFTTEATDNKISLADLRRIDRRIESDLTIEEMDAMIKEFDSNGDGLIDEAEFVQIMTED